MNMDVVSVEVFKVIQNYPNYEVSNFGRVWSKISKKFLKLQKDQKGYALVSLGYKNTKSVHRLVFEAFYRRLLPNEHCHHINKNRSDNRSTNLVARDAYLHESEHKKGQISPMKGKKLTDEQKKQQSQKMKQKWSNQQYRIKMSKAHKGKKLSQQTKKKMSDIRKGKKFTTESINKRILSRRQKYNGKYFKEDK